MPKPFIAYDGRGSEVLVETGEGVISEFSPKTNTTQVKISDNNPKVTRPNSGWITNSDPIYAYIKQAYEEQRNVSYRIEIQRKEGVDVNLPINEVRGKNNMEQAKENTVKIVAAIDGKLTSESVTDPSQDQQGGRVRATANSAPQTSGSSSAPALTLEEVANVSRYIPADQLALIASLAGADKEQLVGFLDNEGQSPAKLAEVTAGLISEILDSTTPDQYESLQALTESILWISDSIQVHVFGRTSPNRIDTSHAQIRSVVLSVVNASSDSALSLSRKDMSIIRSIAEKALSIYQVTLAIVKNGVPQRFLDFNGSSAPAPQTQNQNAPEPQQEAPQSAPEPQNAPAPAEQVSAPQNGGEDAPILFSISAEDLNREMEEANKNDTFASAESIDGFIALSSHIQKKDYGSISEFLEKTFGVRKAADVPDELLSGLVSFYRSTGDEEESAHNFAQAVFYVAQGN